MFYINLHPKEDHLSILSMAKVN